MAGCGYLFRFLRYRHRARVLVACVVSLVPFLAWSQPGWAQRNYRLIKSDIAVAPQDVPPIYWLDEQTAFFRGDVKGKPQLFLWTVGDKPRVYEATDWDPAEIAADYCAADGKLRYAIGERSERADKFARWRSGAPGAEVVEEVAIRGPAARPAAADGATPVSKPGALGGSACGAFQDRQMRGRLWATDPGRGFYLDFGPLRDAADPTGEPVVLMRSDRSKFTRLPVRRDQVMPSCTQYVRHAEAFLIWDCAFNEKTVQVEWKRTGCWPFWQVWPPQGHVERGCLAYGPWSHSEHDLLPTQIGIYFVSGHYTDGRSLKDPGSAGLYRIATGNAIRVASGMFIKPSVSPDGCLIAFTYAANFYALAVESPAQATIAAINICAEAQR
jgi:hypothetical protein